LLRERTAPDAPIDGIGGIANNPGLKSHHCKEGHSAMFESHSRPNSPVVPFNADYQRTRQMTVGDLLLENRIIFLDGPIHDGNANLIVMKLLYLQSENRHQDVHLYVNSPGGSVTATLAIYDTMQFLECPVATYCVGLAASGGAILVAGGAPGKRFILPHAKMMIHQPYGQVGGQVSDIEIQAQEILDTRATLNRILAAHTGQTEEKIAKDTERDRYLSPQAAKEYGLVDEIVIPKKKTAAVTAESKQAAGS